jgi:hypothetical protein
MKQLRHEAGLRPMNMNADPTFSFFMFAKQMLHGNLLPLHIRNANASCSRSECLILPGRFAYEKQ